MPAENSSSTVPYFLQTADGKISLPILFGLIMSAMIGAVILTLAVYALVIRRFNQHFEVKERVSGHHMSFLEATVAQREDDSSSEMSSSTRSSSSSSSPFEDRMQPSEFVEEDFEDVSNIMSPPRSQQKKKEAILANSTDKFSYASSAREVSV